MIFWIVVGTIGVFAAAAALNAVKSRLNKAPEKTSGISEGVLLSIEVPKSNEQGPIAAEMMFSTLHGLLKEVPEIQEHLSFEIVANGSGIRFFAFVPEKFEKFVKSQIYAQYPNAQISKIEDYATAFSPEGVNIAATEVVVSRPYFFPIKTFPDFEVDPLAAITSAIGELSHPQQAWIQLLVRPIPDVWQEPGYKYVEEIRSGEPTKKESLVKTILKDAGSNLVSLIPQIFQAFSSPETLRLPPGAEVGPVKPKITPRLPAGEEEAMRSIEEKLTKLGFETAIRIVGIGEDEESATRQVDSSVAALKQFSTANLNSFVRSGFVKNTTKVLEDYKKRATPSELENIFVLNTEELASLFHLPNISVETPSIAWTKAKKAEYPLELPVKVEPIIGKTSFRGEKISFGIKEDDRRRHIYIIGKTGTGKSCLLENMILSDIKNGEGVALLDPHGESFEKILDLIPDERVEDVVVFDPSDLENPVAFNMLEIWDPDQRGLIASGLLEVFRQRFAFSWGPRMEHILRNCLLTLLDIPNATFLGVTRLLSDTAYMNYIVHLLSDPLLKEFWGVEFKGIKSNPRLVTEAIQPIQNRLGPFLATPMIRNIIGQAKSAINLRELMDGGKIFLVNLAKGKLGEVDSAILGSMLMARLWFAALTRADIPQEERRDFFVYVDEFQDFATGAFATILSEARKYKLNLTFAHQYIAQLPEEVQKAVFGNVGTIISFTLGQEDAHIVAREFVPVFEEQDFINLEKFHIYAKLMIDLTQSRPFSAVTLPPAGKFTGNKEKVVNLSRKKYATKREVVEGLIRRWAEKQFTPGMDDKEVTRLREERKRMAEEKAQRTRSAAEAGVATPARQQLRSSGRAGQAFTSRPEMKEVEEESLQPQGRTPTSFGADQEVRRSAEEKLPSDYVAQDVKIIAEEGKPNHTQPIPVTLKGEIRLK